jgi:hypothetical protein
MKCILMICTTAVFALTGCGGSSTDSNQSDVLAFATAEVVKEASEQVISLLEQVGRVDPECIVDIIGDLSLTKVLALGADNSGDIDNLLSEFSECIADLKE